MWERIDRIKLSVFLSLATTMNYLKKGLSYRRVTMYLIIISITVILLLFFYSDTIYEEIQKSRKSIKPRIYDQFSPKTFMTKAVCDIFKLTPHITSTNQTDLKRWDFQKTVKCPSMNLTNISTWRTKIILDCSDEATMKLTTTNSSADIFQVQFGDKCLQRVIDSCCTDKKPVPNVVHYMYYGGHKELKFFQFLSYMSTVKYMKPCLFLLHGDELPFGIYWDYFVSVYPYIIHVKRSLITEIYGQKLEYKEHGSDVMRIEAIQEYGGIYMDWDQVMLKPLESFRQYEYTQGKGGPGYLTNAVILGKRNATFLTLWHQGYKKYIRNWNANSLYYPMKLARENHHLIHMENYTLLRKEYSGFVTDMFNRNVNWSDNYCIHLYIRYYNKPTDLTVIRKLNITYGAVSRHVFFDNKELCSD